VIDKRKFVAKEVIEMATKMKLKKKSNRLYEYKVRGVKGEKTIIKAQNTHDAVNKAARMYPKAFNLGVERISRTRREYETIRINR
jgi:hypothetical protein